MNLSKLLKSALIYGGAYALIPLFKFFIIPLYVRYLTPEEYGTVNMALTLSGFLTMILTMGLDTAAAREYFDYKEEKTLKKYLIVIVSFLFFINLIIICLLSLMIFYFKDYIQQKYSIDFFSYCFFALVIAFMTPFNSVGFAILQAKQKAADLSFAQIGRVIISASVALILLIIFKVGAISLLWSEITATFCINLHIWTLHLRGTPHIYSFIKNAFENKHIILRQSLLYGLPFVPQNISNWAIAAMDRWILIQYVSMKFVGIYSLGLNIGMGMMLILTSLNNAYLPFFMENAGNENYKYTHNIISQMYVIVVGIAFLSIGGFSDEISRLIAPSEYGGASHIILILSVAYYWTGIYLMVSLPIYHMKKTTILPVIVGISSIINIISNFILIPKFGISGAALSKVISYVFSTFAALFFSERLYPIRYSFWNFWLIAIIASSGTILLYQQQVMLKIVVITILITLSLLRIKILFIRYKSSESDRSSENKPISDIIR